jgi:hypothetical protein
MNSQLTGHPAKLRDGTWGAHVNAPTAEAGDVVRIETRSGKQWTETVDRVIWRGTDSDGNECALVTCVPRARGEKVVRAPTTPADFTPFEDDGLP